MQEITIGTNEAGQRLDKFLAKYMKLAPKSFFYKMMRKKNITLNGKKCDGSERVEEGDEISLFLADETIEKFSEIKVQKIQKEKKVQLSILYEDEALLAVDKPQGMLVHPSFSRQTGTLANRLLGYYDRTGQACAVHPVSRLDRDTFGVVLLAKNAHAHALLIAAEKHKTYHAAVRGVPQPPEGMIDVPIARLSPESLLRCVRADGQPARSAYRTLRTEHGISLLELQPLTGRTHQLRVHCAWLGCPILGDPQYGGAESGGPGQQLCAVSIRFFHPFLKKWLEIRSKQDVSLDFPDGMVV